MVNLKKSKFSYRVSLLFSLFLHVVLIVVFVINISTSNYQWHSETAIVQKPIVTAVTVDSKILSKQIEQIRWEQGAKAREARNRLQRIEQKALLIARQRKKEEEHLKALKMKQAVARKKQLDEEKLATERMQHIQQEVKHLHKEAFFVKQKHLQEQLQEQQIKQEQEKIQNQKKKLEKEHTAQLQGILDKYRAKILLLIQSNWHPLMQDATLYCQLLLHLAPGGVITKVDLLKSSGNSALDRSARLAIIKSSPLPVPQDPALFENFREVRIKMSPQEVKGFG